MHQKKEADSLTQKISIRSSRDLRTHYAQIYAEAKEHPVAITVNGREDTVLLEYGQYMEQLQLISDLQSCLSVYKHLAESVKDFRLGRVYPVDEAFDDILQELTLTIHGLAIADN